MEEIGTIYQLIIGPRYTAIQNKDSISLSVLVIAVILYLSLLMEMIQKREA